MVKDKIVMYECTAKWCKLVIPENHEDIQQQKKKHQRIIFCPECSSPMIRRVKKGNKNGGV